MTHPSRSHRCRPLHGALLGLLALHLAACGSDDPVYPGPVERTSSLRGQVEQGSGYIGSPAGRIPRGDLAPAHLVGAAIRMERITDSGTFESVARDTVLTDINGRFVVSARVADEAELVVVAEKGSIRYRAIATRNVVEDSTITVAPLNEETTVEANLWARIKAGPDPAATSRISTTLFVNSTVAILLSLDPSIFDSAVLPLVGESETHRAVLADPSIGVGSATWNSIEAGRRTALIALEERLDPASENYPAVAAAWEAFFAAERNAYVAAGVSGIQLALAREASSRELVRRAQAVRFDLKRAMTEAAALQRARTTGAAVSGTLSGTGAPNATLLAVASAGVTLRNSLYGAVADQFIRNQFNAYGAAVRTELAAGFASSAASIQAAHDAIIAPGASQATLVASLSAATSAEEVAAAYVAYAAAAEAAARTILNGSSLAEADRTPIARVLMLLAMAV